MKDSDSTLTSVAHNYMVQCFAQHHQKKKQGMVKGKDNMFRVVSLLPWVLTTGGDA